MLTAELVPVRRKDGELRLSPIAGKALHQHLELAEQVVEIASQASGYPREQLQAELLAIGRTSTEMRIIRGFAKLVEDATEFEQDRGNGAAERRELLFERAAQAWQSLRSSEQFPRAQVLDDVASSCGVTPAQFESELFIDLPGAQRVIKAVEWSASDLVSRYDQARIAAILLRAVEVRITFRVKSALLLRDLIRTLKFRQLMFELERLDDGRYRLILTGPYSLFESVTKYGLQLALCWPEISSLEDFTLEADLRWGKQNERLSFSVKAQDLKRGTAQKAVAAVNSEVQELIAALREEAPGATVAEAESLLDLPGVGLCVPDIRFTSPDGATVHLEVMGYWSRQSVWRRVELVEAGMVEPVVFLVSRRLRVSEDVLDADAPSALYVYRGRINPKKVLATINELLARLRKSTPRRKRLPK